MPAQSYVLALDQGTTGSTAVLFDADGQIVSKAYREIRQIYPQPGWVEQDPGELFRSSLAVLNQAIESSGVPLSRIKGLGITNQRETTVLWDRKTGAPVSNAIVWQCRRTAPLCEKMKQDGMTETIRQKTGLPIDAYFSATKLRWLLENVPGCMERARAGELLFGTVDSWLVWNLSRGVLHITDFSNAGRTMLFNIHTLEWDKELLDYFKIPAAVLPQVVPSSQVYGETADGLVKAGRLPICGIAGDQQAALFGQACYTPGTAKNTYGTGSFVLINTGERPAASPSGLITTLAWGLDNKVTYALEGSIFVTGAAVQWLRDGLGIISTADQTEALASAVQDTGGVYFVPALAGLGAPYWDMYARGTIVGITRGTTREHLVRATLEAIAYQTRDVIEAMKSDAGIEIPVLRVDGGGTANDFLMQFQSDILGIPIQRARVAETTALGAAYLAGLAAGVWQNTGEIGRQWLASKTYEPKMSTDRRESLYADWKRAVSRSRDWARG